MPWTALARAPVLERVTGDLAAAGGVRAVVLDDGAERGIRALEFRTGGGLSFDVLVDRAMDIGSAEYRGVGVRAGSRPPGSVTRACTSTGDEDGLSWLRSFSGLMVTAGLDHTLFGGEVDASNYHYPPRTSVRHGLHGRVAQHPRPATGYGERWDRRPLRAVGRGRDPPGRDLRRAPAAAPGGSRPTWAAPRSGSPTRCATPGSTRPRTCSCTTSTWAGRCWRRAPGSRRPSRDPVASDSVAAQGVSHLVLPGAAARASWSRCTRTS